MTPGLEQALEHAVTVTVLGSVPHVTAWTGAVHGVDAGGMTHAVVATDRHGIITEWNEGASALFGHLPAAVLGRPVDLLVPEHLRDAHWAGFHRAMEAPVVRDLAADLPVLCADGGIRSFAGRLLVLSDGLGFALGAVAIYTDSASTGVRPFG